MMHSGREKLAAGILALIVVSALAALSASAALGQEDRRLPSPRPPWINPDGTTDVEKMPDCIPVGGPDGKRIRHADGTEVCIEFRERFQPPTGGPFSREHLNGPDGPGLGRRYDPESGQWYKP